MNVGNSLDTNPLIFSTIKLMVERGLEWVFWMWEVLHLPKKARAERIHTGERRFEYNERGKAFSLKDRLVQHPRVHIGAKRFCVANVGDFSVRDTASSGIRKVHSRGSPWPLMECTITTLKTTLQSVDLPWDWSAEPFTSEDSQFITSIRCSWLFLELSWLSNVPSALWQKVSHHYHVACPHRVHHLSVYRGVDLCAPSPEGNSV